MDRKCLRCDGTDYACVGDSPVKGKWKLFRCNTCSFVWRSTEESYLETYVTKLSEERIRSITWSYDPTLK